MNAIVRLHRNSGSLEKLLMEVLSPENQEPVKGIDALWNRKSTAVLSCIQETSRQKNRVSVY